MEQGVDGSARRQITFVERKMIDLKLSALKILRGGQAFFDFPGRVCFLYPPQGKMSLERSVFHGKTDSCQSLVHAPLQFKENFRFAPEPCPEYFRSGQGGKSANAFHGEMKSGYGFNGFGQERGNAFFLRGGDIAQKFQRQMNTLRFDPGNDSGGELSFICFLQGNNLAAYFRGRGTGEKGTDWFIALQQDCPLEKALRGKGEQIIPEHH